MKYALLYRLRWHVRILVIAGDSSSLVGYPGVSLVARRAVEEIDLARQPTPTGYMGIGEAAGYVYISNKRELARLVCQAIPIVRTVIMSMLFLKTLHHPISCDTWYRFTSVCVSPHLSLRHIVSLTSSSP